MLTADVDGLEGALVEADGVEAARTAGLYVYGIVDRTDAALPVCSGLAGRPIVALPYRDVAAVVCSLDAGRIPAASTAAIRHHEEVVEALMAGSTVLPARFGTVVPDEERLRELLVVSYPAFVETLRRVRGRVELGLRVLSTRDLAGPAPADDGETDALPASPGTAYVRARVREEHRANAIRAEAEDVARGIHGPLAAIACQSTWETAPTPRTLLAAAYLVERGRIESMRREVASAARRSATLRFLLTGPWPPYHFCAGAPVGGTPLDGG